ncbi:MAG: hypothetical protein [Siphoviridae sp. ctvD11]|nr:MAG: hypothetical protein [Siphoviridae sp. ctvD11]
MTPDEQANPPMCPKHPAQALQKLAGKNGGYFWSCPIVLDPNEVDYKKKYCQGGWEYTQATSPKKGGKWQPKNDDIILWQNALGNAVLLYNANSHPDVKSHTEEVIKITKAFYLAYYENRRPPSA